MLITLQYFRKFILIIALVLSILSEILFFNSGFGPISFILVLSPILIFSIFYLYNIAVFNKFLVPIYLFISLLVIYSFLGAIYFGQIGLLAQIYSFLVMPLIFIYLGFFVDRNVNAAINTMLVLVIICSFFSLSQFVYYSYGVAGPFSSFKVLSDLILANQLIFIPDPIYGRATGFFVNPNVLGMFGGLTYWLIKLLQRDNYYWQASIIKILSLCCIFLSFSRTGLIGIVASVAVVYVLNIFTRKTSTRVIKKSILYLFFVLMGFYYLSSYITEYQFQRFNEIGLVTSSGVGQSSNLSGRFDAWSIIFNYIEINPLGTIVPPQLVISESPDNQFIYFFAQGGFILFLATVFFYIYLIYKGLVSGKKYGFAFLGGCIFLLISSFTLVPLNIFVVSLFWMMIGIQAKASNSSMINSVFYKYMK